MSSSESCTASSSGSRRARVIDVTPRHRQRQCACRCSCLLRAVQYLPDGVVLAVVDQGSVPIGGLSRHRRLVDSSWVRTMVCWRRRSPWSTVPIGSFRSRNAFRLPGAGSTFDGRDVFAPPRQCWHREAALLDLGPEVDPGSVTPLLLPLVEHGEGRVSGEVWWIDGYGNAQTNVSPDDLQAGRDASPVR